MIGASSSSREALVEHIEKVLSTDLPPIVTAGHPVLRWPAQDYDGQLDDGTLRRLIATMRRVMHAAPGVGLAAPQIGIPLRIAVLEDPGVTDPAVAEARSLTPLPFTVIINPSYEPNGDGKGAFYEGCLSVPGYQAVVERHSRITATYTQPDGSTVTAGFEGWPAGPCSTKQTISTACCISTVRSSARCPRPQNMTGGRTPRSTGRGGVWTSEPRRAMSGYCSAVSVGLAAVGRYFAHHRRMCSKRCRRCHGDPALDNSCVSPGKMRSSVSTPCIFRAV